MSNDKDDETRTVQSTDDLGTAGINLRDAKTADPAEVQWFQQWFNKILRNVESVIQGKTNQVAMVLSCFFAEGHLLLEDVPGTGKTTLAKALASSIQGEWSRVQFTPDLLPSDVTGGMVYNQQAGEFEPFFGPVFANVVLADEINRASPKTQAALLEVMEERQVTFGNQTNGVPQPFVVMATQNPIEQQGTYRLPEAQLDRFLMRMSLGYADSQHALAMLRNVGRGVVVEDLAPVVSTSDVQRMIAVVDSVHVDESLLKYMIRLVEATRELPEVTHGSSPRGAIGLLRASKSVAAARGRIYVNIDDVKLVAVEGLAHLLILGPEAEFQGVRDEHLIRDLLTTVDLPAVIVD